MFTWPLLYQVYCLSGWSCCLPVVCCLMFAGVVVAMCHVCQVFPLAPHVGCLSLVQVE